MAAPPGAAGRADARWLEMARPVLAEHGDASTPTQNLILARTAARLDAEHATGVVPLPARTWGAGTAVGVITALGPAAVTKASGSADRSFSPESVRYTSVTTVVQHRPMTTDDTR